MTHQPRPHSELAKIGAETRAIYQRGSYVAPGGHTVELRALVDAAVAATFLLREPDLDALVSARPPSPSPPAGARVRCWELRSGACAQRLLEEGARQREAAGETPAPSRPREAPASPMASTRKVAVLNYANGVTPGGGFLGGSRAQEESLCRCSSLYACLVDGRARAYYDENEATGSALCNGAVIVSPDVPFFRDEELALLDAPFVATVLTAAAPDLSHGYARERDKPWLADVPDVFRRRTRYVLAAAHHAGCDAVVAGPWGCGAFGNDADVVAAAFDGAVARWRDAFSDIVFSTWGPPANREPFERRFPGPG